MTRAVVADLQRTAVKRSRFVVFLKDNDSPPWRRPEAATNGAFDGSRSRRPSVARTSLQNNLGPRAERYLYTSNDGYGSAEVQAYQRMGAPKRITKCLTISSLSVPIRNAPISSLRQASDLRREALTELGEGLLVFLCPFPEDSDASLDRTRRLGLE